jgi:hypothetical protein
LEIWDEYGNIVSVQELVDPGEKNKVGNVWSLENWDQHQYTFYFDNIH